MESKQLNLRITLLTQMLGTIPKNKEIYSKFIATKDPAKQDEVETIQEMEEKGWTGFHSDDQGLFIFDYVFKGFIKEAGNVLKEQCKIKNLRSKIDSYVFVSPRKIYLGLKEPHGVIERSLRVMTMQGPRVTLARSDYVDAGTKFDISLTIITNKEITEELILELMKYGEFKGLGQFRNGSYGRFGFEVI